MLKASTPFCGITPLYMSVTVSILSQTGFSIKLKCKYPTSGLYSIAFFPRYSRESIYFHKSCSGCIQFAILVLVIEKNELFPSNVLARPLLVVEISSLWSVSTSKNSNKAFLHLMARDQVFLLYLSAVTFHFYKCPWHMIHCIAIWLVSNQPRQFCCGLLAAGGKFNPEFSLCWEDWGTSEVGENRGNAVGLM